MDGVERIALPAATSPRVQPDARSQERRRAFERALRKRTDAQPEDDGDAGAPSRAGAATAKPARPAVDGTGRHVDLLA